MSNVIINKDKLDTLATAISLKTGNDLPFTLAEMTEVVDDIIVPEGTKSISANGTGIDVTAYASVDVAVSGADNTLVVTVYWDSTTGHWLPNKTYAEISTANSSGKTIVVNTNDYSSNVSADGSWATNVFEYWVRQYFYDETHDLNYIYEYGYSLESDNSVSGLGEYTYLEPSGTKSITQNGTGIDVTAYAAVDVAVEGESINDKFITVTFNNNLETGAVSLYRVTPSNSAVGSSGYVEMTSTASILAGGTVTRLMPYGFGLVVRGASTNNAGTQNYELCIGNTVISPYIEGFYNDYYYHKFYFISKSNLDSSNNVIDLYSTQDPYKDTVITDTLSVTSNGTYTASSGTAYSSVTVAVPSGSPTLQSKTNIDPTTSSQTITADNGYDGLSSVQINAMPSGSATTPTTTITTNPSISISNTGLITATASASQSVTPTVSAGYVSSGTAGTVSVSGSNTSQMAGAWGDIDILLNTSTGLITANGSMNVDQNQGIGFVTEDDSFSETLQLTTQAAATITPTESSQTAVAAGKYTTGAVTVAAIPSNYVGSGIDQRDDTDLTASGATVTVPAGYYASQETKSVASGTEGTPTATKGTVSNHAVSVTPSVTNTAGYISGGTKTGTAVSVSASELVSGTLTIDSSGTKDVTNYASASVAAGAVTAPSSISGTSATVSTGTNTLTLSKTVSVTPSVTTAGYISSGTAGNSSVSLTANVTTKAAATITPSTSNQTIAAGTYLTGAQTISGDANLVSNNIISGKSIFGVAGSVTFQTIYTGSSNPSSSTGVNGDVYIKVVS